MLSIRGPRAVRLLAALLGPPVVTAAYVVVTASARVSSGRVASGLQDVLPALDVLTLLGSVAVGAALLRGATRSWSERTRDAVTLAYLGAEFLVVTFGAILAVCSTGKACF